MRYREFRIAETALKENASGFTQITVGSQTYDVGNDLIRSGNSYAIFSGDSARQWADANGYIVPPIEVIQAVYAQGRQLVMPPRPNNPTDTNAEAHTQDIFEANGLSGFPSGLVYGHKKEVVAGPRTRIFGGVWANGNIIQSDSSVHGGGYVDYSQGMRACRLANGSTASLEPTASTSGDPTGGEEDTATVDGVITAGPPYPAEDMAAVRDLQTKLEQAGYSVGSTGIDGKYGPRTTRAVAAFKADYSDQVSNTAATTVNPEDLAAIAGVASGSIPRVETPRLTGNTVEIDPETGNRVRSRTRGGSSGGARTPTVPVDDYTPSNSLFDGPESDRASVRFNNPGAMYPARWQSRFGGTDTGARIGGGHRIAMFPDRVSGAAALFALLDGRLYRDKTVAEALRIWTGGNSSSSYIRFMQDNGIDTQEIVRNYLANPEAAVGLAVLMARWETGHAYPLSRSEWEEAYERAGVGS